MKIEEPLTYPYFKHSVPDFLINKRSSEDILYPTEWVGLHYKRTTKTSQTEFTFVQVAYPIFLEKPEASSHLLVKQYKVFLSEDDYEGRIVDSLELRRLESTVQGESGRRQLEHQSQPDKDYGRVWMEQVDIDFKILEDLFERCESHPELNLYATICFLAQQVAEKALTGGIIYFIGDKVENFNLRKDHNLSERVNALQYMEGSIGGFDQLVSAAEALDDYYLKTRYPNLYDTKRTIPANQYDKSAAKRAYENACCVRNIIQTTMNKN